MSGFQVNHRMYTTRLGPNCKSRNNGTRLTIKDADRVRKKFANASVNNIVIIESSLSTKVLMEHVVTYGPALVLVDEALLSCDLCKHNKLSSEIRRAFGGQYRGHYILVVGVVCVRGGYKLVYRDPARNESICAAPPRRLNAARLAPYTDCDLIMATRTITNDKYSGLVENISIPASLHQYNGKTYSKVGSAMPIHCATQEEKRLLSKTTHHYCDLFTEDLFAPLEELVFVRLDENKAEKVFLNRHKRLLLTSSDGELAEWQCAPTFESLNKYVAGAPLAGRDGKIISLLTACHGNHYAVSHREGDGGYFETSKSWKIKDMEEGRMYYGDKSFSTRDELRAYIESLPPLEVSSSDPPQPILLRGKIPRIILVAANGRQLSHQYIHGNVTSDIEYL